MLKTSFPAICCLLIVIQLPSSLLPSSLAADAEAAAAGRLQEVYSQSPFAAVELVQDLGSLEDREKREGVFRLTNRSATTLRVMDVRVTCPCLVAPGFPEHGAQVAPGAVLEVPFLFDAEITRHGPFSKFLLLNVKEMPAVKLSVYGTVVNRVSLKPARVIDLGSVRSLDKTWQRQVTIEASAVEPGELVLDKTKGNEFFNLALTRETDRRYKLTVRPKVPFPHGRVRETVYIPVVKPAGIRPLAIGIKGQVGEGLKVMPLQVDLKVDGATASGEIRLIQPYKGTGGDASSKAQKTPWFQGLQVHGIDGVKWEAKADGNNCLLSICVPAEQLVQARSGCLYVLVPGYMPAEVYYNLSR